MSNPSTPYIEAHLCGNVLWIDMLAIPTAQRGHGAGKAFYAKWESQLPPDVHLIRIHAADTGNGSSHGFWEKMGFDFQYEGDNLGYESAQAMWKGVHGHPTPATIRVDSDDQQEVDSIPLIHYLTVRASPTTEPPSLLSP